MFFDGMHGSAVKRASNAEPALRMDPDIATIENSGFACESSFSPSKNKSSPCPVFLEKKYAHSGGFEQVQLSSPEVLDRTPEFGILLKLRVFPDKPESVLSGCFQQPRIPHNICNLQIRQS